MGTDGCATPPRAARADLFLLIHRKIAFGLTAGAVRVTGDSSGSPPAACSPASRARRCPTAPARLEAGLGGVVLFAWNVESRQQVAQLSEALRGEREDVVVGIDEEGGDVTRLEAERGSSYPGNWALGHCRRP